MSDKKSIMVGVRLDNIHPWFNQHLSVINNLNYDKDKLRIVYSLQDNVNTRNMAEKLKQFRDESKLNIEVYKEPYDSNLKKYGPDMSSVIFKEWQNMCKEDYFMLLDSDIVLTPEFAVNEMIRVNQPIVAPYIYIHGTNQFYDTWKFRLNGRLFHNSDVPGLGLLKPIQIDSAGGMMLVKNEIFKQLEISNPYPTVSMCYDASRKGYRTVGLPYIRVLHENLAARGITHKPLPQQLGGYPTSNYPASYYDGIKTIGDIMPSTPELLNFLKVTNEEYCKSVNNYAKSVFDKSPLLQKEKSLKWVENISKFYNFYFTKDPLKIMYNYYYEPMPEWFEIETSTTCQFRCKMCEHTYWNEKSEFMDFDTFRGIADQFTDLKWIGMSGIGESFLHPDYRKMMKYIKEKDSSIYIEFFDQFYLEDKKTFKEWIDYSYDKVYLSMDGATKEVYEAQRPGSNYEKVLSNLKLFDAMKKDAGKSFPRLCIHYIINKDNVHEAAKFIYMIKDLGIDVWFIQFTKVLHTYPEIAGMQIDVKQDVIDAITKASKETCIEVRFNVNTNETKAPSHICTAYTQPFIFVDGTVISCCACNEQNDRQYQKATSLGNIKTQTLEEIWHGDKMREYRKKLYSGEVNDVCKRCPLFNTRATL